MITPSGYGDFPFMHSKSSPPVEILKDGGACENELVYGPGSLITFFVQCIVESYHYIYGSKRTRSLVLSKFLISETCILNGFEGPAKS